MSFGPKAVRWVVLGMPAAWVILDESHCIAQSRDPQNEPSWVWCFYGLCCWVQGHQ